MNQYGRIVQLVAQHGRNIGFGHFQTPANVEAIQIAACVVGWLGGEQKYYRACKLLTKSEDNKQPGNCKTASKGKRNSQSVITTASSDVEGCSSTALGIKNRPLQGHTRRAGGLWEDWENTELQ